MARQDSMRRKALSGLSIRTSGSNRLGSPLLQIALLAGLAQASVPAAAGDGRVRSAADAAHALWLEEEPILALSLGKPPAGLPDPSPAALAERATRADAINRTLDDIDAARLSLDDAILLDKTRWFLARARANAAMAPYVFPIGGYTAPAVRSGDLFAGYPLASAADRAGYLALLRDAARLVDNLVPMLEAQAQRGVAVPKLCLAAGVQTFESFAAGLPGGFVPEAERLKGVDPADAARFLAEARRIVAAELAPAATRFVQFGRGPFAARGSDQLGMAQYPGGADAYSAVLRSELTQDTTAAAVNAVGRTELADVQAPRAAIFSQFGHTSGPDEFEAHVKQTRPDLLSHTREDYGRRIDADVARIVPLMPRLFIHQPRSPFTSRPMPEALEATMTFGWFQVPTKPGKAGVYYYNGTPGRPMLGASTLAWHEGLPGHHYQWDLLQARRDSVHPLLRDVSASFFNEGWAVYSTTLAEDVGLATDPVTQYDLLQDKAFMSTRLVVDTGLNSLGMSTDEAISLLRREGGVSESEARTEAMRYGCQMPGQALGYQFGAISIARARARAQKALGDRFDIRQFHDAILRHGEIGQASLDRIVDHLIASGGMPGR